jgi:hypothetical protein
MRLLVYRCLAEGKPVIAVGALASHIVAFVKEVGKRACLVKQWDSCNKIEEWIPGNAQGIIEEPTGEYYTVDSNKIIHRGKISFC